MEEENDQDIINGIAQVVGVLGDKKSLVDSRETETSERSNGPSSINKKVTRIFGEDAHQSH